MKFANCTISKIAQLWPLKSFSTTMQQICCRIEPETFQNMFFFDRNLGFLHKDLNSLSIGKDNKFAAKSILKGIFSHVFRSKIQLFLELENLSIPTNTTPPPPPHRNSYLEQTSFVVCFQANQLADDIREWAGVLLFISVSRTSWLQTSEYILILV